MMAIEKWKVPRTISEMREFLGFTNYYSCYVKDYAKVVACLQDKLCVSKVEGKKKVLKCASHGPKKTNKRLMKSNVGCAQNWYSNA